HVRVEGLPAPDIWLPASADADHRNGLLASALETAALRTEMRGMQAGLCPATPVVQSSDGRPPDLDALNRLMSGLSSGFDLDRLLEAFTDAVSQFSQCAGYTLLWEAEDGCLRVSRHRGLRAEIVEGGRLSPTDALPMWYRRNRRVLSLAELADWSDQRLAVRVCRELEVFGGQIALPLMVRGRLAGVLMLGEKALGESYSRDELETLFSVTNHVALAAQGVELHTELSRSKAQMESIVESMGAGLITLGIDERIAVCNPYAAEVLGLSRSEVESADLRALPSPLGDMLYAALRSEADGLTSGEVEIRGGQSALRVSTTRVCDESGQTLGSVLMLDDVTAERELLRERSRRERLDVLTRIVGRIAHEVKNPLTAVKTYAELMTGRREDAQLARFWSETVLPEIDRLDHMLKNLLRMVEQPEPHVEPARIEDLVAGALDVLPMAEEVKRQAFDLQFAKDLPPVLVDPTPTRDAISYLLGYLAGSRPHPVHVEVLASDPEDSGVMVRMSRRTRENGKFDPETVFDPLTAMQSLESDLGPVISQKIITNQQGQVDAWHEEGRMMMSVTLPRSEAQVAPRQEVY
ncbi:MAG TPA: hypothetical protein DEP45_10910, partial [Armatimonadetes bacterium]|nr:hypothetical protein [Armatimonadota bacterium]